MKRPSDSDSGDRNQFQRLIGLGDLSARKSYYPALQQTIEDLRNEKEKFERIFSGALNGIFRTTVEGSLMIANPAIAGICGYETPEDFIAAVQDIGSRLFNSATEKEHLLKKLRNEGFVVDYEAEFKRKDNEVIVVAMNVRLNATKEDEYLEFFVQDITDRKRSEEELRKHREHLEELVRERTVEIEKANQALKESEERFRSLSDAAFEGIVITAKGIILDCNDAFCTMLGYQSSELISKVAIELVLPEEREDVGNKILSGYEGSYESHLVRKDGYVIPVEIHGKMFSYKGKLVRVAAIRDITERKRAIELLNEREKLVNELEKSMSEVKTLQGFLPICSSCKKIRDDKGYWNQIESYIAEHSAAQFSHGICEECADKLYSDLNLFNNLDKNHE